jgi:hypothetical protein
VSFAKGGCCESTWTTPKSSEDRRLK